MLRDFTTSLETKRQYIESADALARANQQSYLLEEYAALRSRLCYMDLSLAYPYPGRPVFKVGKASDRPHPSPAPLLCPKNDGH